MVAFEFERGAADQGIDGEREDDDSQRSFDEALMAAGEKQEAERNAEQSGEDEPAGAAEMNFPPVLHHHDERDGDGEQHYERRGGVQGNEESEQRNGDEALAKAEGGANQRGDEDNR